MNIKQAETLSGVSKRNIRYYEQEGLIRPVRNAQNDYREYSPEDIEALKLIRALRMVDMPLEQIRAVLNGGAPIREAAAAQKEKLRQRVQQLEAAIRFCGELEALDTAAPLDVDRLLERMNAPEVKAGLYHQWVHDYKQLARAERQKVFTFMPDGAVTNAREFTDALLWYANANGLDLVITKESMYPEFTIGGVEYTAERLYATVQRVPVAVVRCTAVHPEDFEPDLPKGKKRLLKVLHYGWLLIPLILMNMHVILRVDWAELLTTLEGWLVLLSVLALGGTGIYRAYLLHYNENGKKG